MEEVVDGFLLYLGPDFGSLVPYQEGGNKDQNPYDFPLERLIFSLIF